MRYHFFLIPPTFSFNFLFPLPLSGSFGIGHIAVVLALLSAL